MSRKPPSHTTAPRAGRVSIDGHIVATSYPETEAVKPFSAAKLREKHLKMLPERLEAVLQQSVATAEMLRKTRLVLKASYYTPEAKTAAIEAINTERKKLEAVLQLCGLYEPEDPWATDYAGELPEGVSLLASKPQPDLSQEGISTLAVNQKGEFCD